ncbi:MULTISPECIES: murein hydrolase activator EnvC [unclassified Paludibacterium]|uniref:murein hydrolase activator EnvC family protein n=1 Tax=unclassified Paludibacterium TaxID=2618429 RepID=UPI001C053312|nr:peptidoglycan DD-metalloendopeptidase family protein [Paludibacterium sp. B53371]BEV73566.1 murein hydrolase activator EnvC [Paludibacterium sp. THUN1379]
MKRTLLLLLLLAGPTWAASNNLSTAPQQKNLKAVRQQIDTLQKDIAQKQAVQKQAQTAIQQSEVAIQQTNQVLNQLGKKQNASSARLADLEKQIRDAQQQVALVQQKVAQMLARQYRNGEHDAMKLMLNGSDPNQTSRDMVYYQYIARAQQKLIADLNQRQATLAQLAEQLEQQLHVIVSMSTRKAQEKSQLQQAKASKQQQVNQLGNEIQNRQDQLAKLKQDEKRLTDLIADINRKIQQQIAERKAKEKAAFKARQEAARKENERRRKLAAEAQKQGKPVPEVAKSQVPVETVDSAADDSNAGRAFRSLQGRMKLPVTGEIAGRFGSMRNEGTTWKGVFIHASRGQAVHVVADGRVVYADALRGFGNAVIVDHGGNYLTVYTGLSAIGRGVGDAVKAGDSLGSTGALDSGEAGLYFEIRYLGKPINPLTWVH